jgi:hypothetical protein
LTYRGVNAAAESFFSTLEWELFRKQPFTTKRAARRAVARFIDWYNRSLRHSSCQMTAPVPFEATLAAGDGRHDRRGGRGVNTDLQVRLRRSQPDPAAPDTGQ